MHSKFKILKLFIFILLACSSLASAQKKEKGANLQKSDVMLEQKSADLQGIVNQSIFARSIDAGPVVFMVLIVLVFLSIAGWGVSVAKFFYLRKVADVNDDFIERFWENRSLNDLNSKLVNFDDSPAKELFKAGYSELVKGSQLKDQASDVKVGIGAAMSNLSRTLVKAKNLEKRKWRNFYLFLQ